MNSLRSYKLQTTYPEKSGLIGNTVLRFVHFSTFLPRLSSPPPATLLFSIKYGAKSNRALFGSLSLTNTIIKPNSSVKTSNQFEISNILDKHFATIGYKLASKFSLSQNSFAT